MPFWLHWAVLGEQEEKAIHVAGYVVRLAIGAKSIANLAGAFSISNPKGEWSFISIGGQRRTRIDHATVSDTSRVSDPEYLATFEDIVLVGSNGTGATSDHGVLALTITA